MNTVNQLLEGASPYQVLQDQAGKLAGKWRRSGLLEGIDSSTEKNNMAMLLENQAKQLVNEAGVSGGHGAGTNISTGTGEAWAGVALPLVRRVFGEIVAKDLISVQPMNLPAGLIFYLDFRYGSSHNADGKTIHDSLYGAVEDMTRTDGNFNKGLYGTATYGYSINSASVLCTDDTSATGNTASMGAILEGVGAGGADTLNNIDILRMDTEFSASYAGQFGATLDNTSVTDNIRIAKVPTVSASGYDADAIRSFTVQDVGGSNIKKVFPQFTRINGANFEFVVSAAAGADLSTLRLEYFKKPVNLNDVGDFEASGSTFPANGVSGLAIPEINVQMKSDTVSAKTRKLKAQWTPEFAQDLNAYHSIDAEAELTSILSEYISMEIDLEILQNADTVEGWSAKVGHDASVASNNTAAGSTNPNFSITDGTSGVYYTKMSWFQTLGVKLQKVSNLIHQKTLRGGANWMVISPKVATILESIPGFAADSSGDKDKFNMGVQKIGAINNRYTVYKNPYMTENVILMGYKGSQFLETGAVFAPYIPLIMTPLVYDPVSFTPRKGIMTRYAKKMVRPDFYGKVFIADLDQV
jgi:hypothetical protein